jgi:Tfp pilus assembly protein PilX
MNNKGFSIIIAMGTIGVLLIIVVGLASTYLRELRLTRSSYDDIVAYASAEGMFEYGMLKVHNHREGFQDQVNTTDNIDGKENFLLTTDRSR